MINYRIYFEVKFMEINLNSLFNKAKDENNIPNELYQKYGVFKKVADIMGRDPKTVSRHIHEREAAVNAVRVVIDAQNT